MDDGFAPELIIGIVTPVGTDTGGLAAAIRATLSDWKYESVIVRLSGLIPSEPLPAETEDQRIKRLIEDGDKFCEAHQSDEYREGDAAAVAKLGIAKIRQARVALHRRDGRRGRAATLAAESRSRTAYIIQSLKRPTEVELLRGVYSDQFLLFGSQDKWSQRIERLTSLPLSESSPQSKTELAKELVELDAKGSGGKVGQHLNKTYHLADFFVSQDDVNRIVDILFGQPVAPNVGEFAMYSALAASARSLSPSRKVGAAISSNGRVVTTGYNDVPDGQRPDVIRQIDFSEKAKALLIDDVVMRLESAGIFSCEGGDRNRESATRCLAESKMMDVIEFQRAVHAEARAMDEAAAAGISIAGADLYVTTHPCHLCFKQALSVGIRHIWYIEPYPKSRALEMFEGCPSDQLAPFVGVAPRRYIALFAERPSPEAGPGAKFPVVPRETALPLVGKLDRDKDRNRRERVAVGELRKEYQ